MIDFHCRSATAEAVAVACRIRKCGVEAAAFKADLAHAHACATLVEQVEQTLGPIPVPTKN